MNNSDEFIQSVITGAMDLLRDIESFAESTKDPVTQWDFADVLRALKKYPEAKAYRLGWNGKNQYIKVQKPGENSKMTRPYFYIRTVQGDLVPWLASQTDLLATDWILE